MRWGPVVMGALLGSALLGRTAFLITFALLCLLIIIDAARR